MDPIIKRLLESKSQIDVSVFNAPNDSDESWDLYDIIQDRVVSSVRRLFGDEVDVDDSGLDSRGSTSGNRAVIYKASIAGFSNGQTVPLNRNSWDRLLSDLTKYIDLPEGDDNYNYDVEMSHDETLLKITLIRRSI